MQLADRNLTLAKGVFFVYSPLKLFGTTRLASGFRATKNGADLGSVFLRLYLMLELRVAHRSGVQLHVADVADAGEVHDHALEAQTIAGWAA